MWCVGWVEQEGHWEFRPVNLFQLQKRETDSDALKEGGFSVGEGDLNVLHRN